MSLVKELPSKKLDEDIDLFALRCARYGAEVFANYLTDQLDNERIYEVVNEFFEKEGIK